MANSIADMIVASGLQSSKEVPDLAGSLGKGVEIAQHIQQTQAQREALEMQKQQHQLNKVDKLTSAMEVGAKIKSKSARNAYFKNYIPQMQAALGLQDFIPPETMAMIQADPEEAKKFSLLKAKIKNGDMTYDQAVSNMDPEQWAMLDDSEVQQLEAAEQFRIQQEGADRRSQNPNDRLAKQFDTRQILTIKDKFDQNTRKDFERYTASNNTLALLKSNMPIADEAAKSQFLRLAGEVGSLTEGDYSRVAGSRAVMDKGAQLFERAAKGTLTEDNRKQLLKATETFKQIVDAKIRAQAERSIKGGKTLGFDESKLKEVIDAETMLAGGNVTDKQDQKISDYAKKYKLSYEQAAQILTKRGYKPGGE